MGSEILKERNRSARKEFTTINQLERDYQSLNQERPHITKPLWLLYWFENDPICGREYRREIYLRRMEGNL